MHMTCKFDGGKVINRSQSGSWQHRCVGAGLEQNHGSTWSPKMWNSMTEDTPNSMPKMWGIPETPPVAHTEISSSYCRGLTCSLTLKLALQVEGPSTFSNTQEMFGECLEGVLILLLP